MPEPPVPLEIPNRALKAAEVCDLLKVQPYVLRSWEAEFPELGVAKGTGTGRLYRRGDVEQVLRIKHLLLVEGLTLAGARRRIEEQAAPPVVDEVVVDDLALKQARERITEVKRGLRTLHEMLGQRAGQPTLEFELAPPDEPLSGAYPHVGNEDAAVEIPLKKAPPSPRRKRSA